MHLFYLLSNISEIETVCSLSIYIYIYTYVHKRSSYASICIDKAIRKIGSLRGIRPSKLFLVNRLTQGSIYHPWTKIFAYLLQFLETSWRNVGVPSDFRTSRRSQSASKCAYLTSAGTEPGVAVPPVKSLQTRHI